MIKGLERLRIEDSITEEGWKETMNWRTERSGEVGEVASDQRAAAALTSQKHWLHSQLCVCQHLVKEDGGGSQGSSS